MLTCTIYLQVDHLNHLTFYQEDHSNLAEINYPCRKLPRKFKSAFYHLKASNVLLISLILFTFVEYSICQEVLLNLFASVKFKNMVS